MLSPKCERWFCKDRTQTIPVLLAPRSIIEYIWVHLKEKKHRQVAAKHISLQSMPDVRKTTHLVRTTVVVNNFTMDQPPEKVKPMAPLSQFVEISDGGKVIKGTKMLDSLLSNLIKTCSIIVAIAYHLTTSMDGVAYHG